MLIAMSHWPGSRFLVPVTPQVLDIAKTLRYPIVAQSEVDLEIG